MKLCLPLSFLFTLLCSLPIAVRGADRPQGRLWATRSEVVAQNGIVATSEPLASQVGLEVLKRGGSAVDAAIAANAMQGLVSPYVNGMGGDLFAIVWDPKTEKLYGLNASGRSPLGLTREVFEANGITESIPTYGKYSVSVPGCVDGWFELHGQFGTLSMEEILNPVIEYARKGAPITQLSSNSWKNSVRVRGTWDNQPGFLDTFSIDGRGPEKGEIWKNEALANTLEKIAQGGRDVFYRGEIADTIDAYFQEIDGYLRKEDLVAHRSEWVEPVSTNYRGWDVWELPPNGQGIAALQMLNILEGYDIASMGFGSAEYIHALVEAKKLAFEDRAKYYADPEFSEIPLDWLISKEYAAERRALIDTERAAREYAPGVLQHGETIYLCAADKDGMMVSLIQSNFAGFGSGVCIPELGFGFQNRGASFTFEEGHANQYQPGKRPFHTIIPAFVTEDGKPLIAFGVMGGQMQPQGHTQIIVNLKDFGMNLQEAGDAPRVNHMGSTQPFGPDGKMTDGGEVLYESGIPPEVVRDLALKRHKMMQGIGYYFGGYQAIMRDPATGVYLGASESRSDGQAAGY
ncbi:gamma-glutamyltransferase [Pelagicoccus albus]|uniref:Glutathione hydrolase proenzyme n=1 Tax=Pelagicoccus albus TaxID=415222 RepID=A0A7X1B7J9_9BACT|nr:gamma-glutamyltransferase [Pelagicoccus albus]MBC2607135.1 gamma-glutamyltransferase [Pelagicoccus albus]